MTATVSRPLIVILLVSSFFICTASNASVCKPEIRRNNIVANALFTTLFRSINGELRSWSDFGESVVYGGTAGYMFYKSREMIGDGRENFGMATAYLASSITENTTFGEHPLAHLRFGIGPMDLQLSTHWARNEDAMNLSIGINALDTIGLVSTAASGQASGFKVRNGVIVATDRGIIEDDFDGYTIGKTVYLREEARDDPGLWRHELIHATQYLQYSSFGALGYNPFDFDKYTNRKSKQTGIGMHVRIEWFNALINQIDNNRKYEDRWMEIEAARLAQDTSPLHDPHDNNCGSQVGFQLRF